MNKLTILFLVLILIVNTSFNSVNVCLCNKYETNIISFKIENSSKSVSICEGQGGKYLVYRFGKKEKIELEFPNKKDESSWDKFNYDNYYRGGGYQNAAHTDFLLSFKNKEANYEIYHSYSVIDTLGNINTIVGIRVDTDDKHTSLTGDPSTLIGSLEGINEEKLNKNNE